MLVFEGFFSYRERIQIMGSGKNRWRISFHRSAAPAKKQPPIEFICPISGSLMADPVIVSSGQTFERNCVSVCKNAGFNPLLSDGSIPDFSTIIPNLALKSTIFNWCRESCFQLPKPIDQISAEKLVLSLVAAQKNHTLIEPPPKQDEPYSIRKQSTHSKSELTRVSTSSSESVATVASGPISRPSCYYSSQSSSSEIETLIANSSDEEEFIVRLTSSLVHEQEDSLISLRKMTRTKVETRSRLCTSRLMSILRSLITSRYAAIQVNATAALVNLSLENRNKVKIVRSGIVPPLIDVLKGGFPEAQDHAAGALFSLALDDQNKTAIGVLGALQPLMHALRSESERTRHDSSLALYHLSLVQSNRSKLVKLGAVQTLMGMVKSGHILGRVMLILSNLAGCADGRATMLDSGAVEWFLGMLRRNELEFESGREICIGTLYGLSQGGLRFKAVAKAAGAEEVMEELEKTAGVSGGAGEKVRRVLEVLRGKEEEEEEVDWEELLNTESDEPCRRKLSSS